jgi:2-polyprenyl-3-methyl-5-hydroxy-6-metoxy-1,4-benzoquinol methylase
MSGESEKAYYDQRWGKEDKANLWAMQRASLILRELSNLGIKQPRVFDMGCGTGWMTEILAQFGDASGLDVAPAAAQRFHPELTFYGVDDDVSEPFDVVLSQEVIEHVEDQPAYLDRAASLLHPGGYLILTTPNAKVSLRHRELLIQPVENHLTSNQLRHHLERHFEVQSLYSFFYGYAPNVPYRLQMRFGRWLNAGLHLMAVARLH